MPTPRSATTPMRQTWMSMRSPNLFPAGVTIIIANCIATGRSISGIMLLHRDNLEHTEVGCPNLGLGLSRR